MFCNWGKGEGGREENKGGEGESERRERSGKTSRYLSTTRSLQIVVKMKTGWSCPRGQSKNGEGRTAPGPEKTDTQGPGLEEAVLPRWQGTQQPSDAQGTERSRAPGVGSLGTGRHSLVARRPPRQRHGRRTWLSGSGKRNGRAWQMPPADHGGKVAFTSVIPGPTQ